MDPIILPFIVQGWKVQCCSQRHRCSMAVFTASLLHLRSYIMNGIESIHITVFHIANVPGEMCCAAEMEAETCQRLHFQHWSIWHFFS